MSAHAGPAAQQQPSSDEKAVAPTLHALDEQVAAAAITPLEQGAHQNRFGLLSIIGLSYAILVPAAVDMAGCSAADSRSRPDRTRPRP